MIFKTDIHPWIQYLIVILLVCFSGNQPFTGGAWGDARAIQLLIAFFLFLGVLYITRRKSPLALRDLSVIFLFLMILAIQALSFNFFPLVTIAGFIIRLFIGFAAIRLVDNFPRIYINVMYVICIISLCFYVPEQLFYAAGRDFASLFTPAVHLVREVFLFCCDAHILIYNFEFPEEVRRNAGIFWEPGAFAGYILLALIFLGLERERYDQRFYISRLFVLTISLLTTRSTMGYIVLPVALSIHYRQVTRSAVENLARITAVILALPLFMALLVNAWNLEFIGSKIRDQYEWATKRDRPGWERIRFGTALADWKYIKRRPMFGWGIHPKTEFALDPEDQLRTKGAGNGATGFIHKFGILGMVTFILFAWTGFYKLSRESLLRSVTAVFAILLSLTGEEFLSYPLYLGLMFVTVSREKRRVCPT